MPGKWSTRFPVYQIDFTAVASGKRVATSKRRVRWRFGFSNQSALDAGESGTSCRGEEHDVTVVWSVTSGKRLILADGQEVHYSTERSSTFEFSWTMRGNHVLKVVCFATPQITGKEVTRQYDLSVDGQSFFVMPKVYELGIRGPISSHAPIPGVVSGQRSSQPPRYQDVRQTHHYEKSSGAYAPEVTSRQREEEDLKRAIQNSIEESRQHLNRNTPKGNPTKPKENAPAARKEVDLLDMGSLAITKSTSQTNQYSIVAPGNIYPPNQRQGTSAPPPTYSDIYISNQAPAPPQNQNHYAIANGAPQPSTSSGQLVPAGQTPVPSYNQNQYAITNGNARPNPSTAHQLVPATHTQANQQYSHTSERTLSNVSTMHSGGAPSNGAAPSTAPTQVTVYSSNQRGMEHQISDLTFAASSRMLTGPEGIPSSTADQTALVNVFADKPGRAGTQPSLSELKATRPNKTSYNQGAVQPYIPGDPNMSSGTPRAAGYNNQGAMQPYIPGDPNMSSGTPSAAGYNNQGAMQPYIPGDPNMSSGTPSAAGYNNQGAMQPYVPTASANSGGVGVSQPGGYAQAVPALTQNANQGGHQQQMQPYGYTNHGQSYAGQPQQQLTASQGNQSMQSYTPLQHQQYSQQITHPRQK